ncbi:endoribonuclease ZC3H12A-like isoform X1 [Rhopalosiphum padi]|uniref:endoribonuclease ZC3H12A-like isoform X1 n=1 Tax=Rhopalosiphum padi TaxID=40932 RepID=UPI00298EA28A|nr:endoribonuclease ZC3H12A-like isoform X1 [Rhopalosiphum padi]XP_060849725.1 endoribonuclease ZC3H12A-like isoform X1 [Rhopalosiphum padi]
MDRMGPLPPPSATNATLSVDSSKGRLVVDRIDSIRNLFGCELRIVHGGSGSSTAVVFAVTRLDEYDRKLPDDHLIDRLKCYVDSLDELQLQTLDECSNDDSSYDSDFGGDDDASGSQHFSGHHDDISRTTSDTLGAEYADYVSAAAYKSRVDFALKLGYTERLVQTAINKLGPEPTQDQLLAELIKLGAQCSHKLHCESDGEDSQSNNTNDPLQLSPQAPKLRHVVIDGSNVAMSHGNKETFSCRGIKICVDWFRMRGHTDITVFVPKWRKEASRPDNRRIIDQDILTELERARMLVFTPSREIGGKRMVCYDDRYILRLASELDGVVVSNDNYRDLANESPAFRSVVQNNILMYSFVNDRFMPPDDPLGRSGPTLDVFLRSKAPGVGLTAVSAETCPYGKKCTYGNKCKFSHPERGLQPVKSVTERLMEHVQRQGSAGRQIKGKSVSLPLQQSGSNNQKKPLARTMSNVPPLTTTTSTTHHHPHWIGGGAWTTTPPPSSNNAVYCGRGKPADSSEPEPDCSNLHHKLQRQLTLNPTYDPRLVHLRQSQHCNVTRIASAPPVPMPQPQAMNLPPHTMAASCSDPQIFPGYHEARQKLYYHLASIFPEEQVSAAMQYYPNETNPQKICAAILNMFSKT